MLTRASLTAALLLLTAADAPAETAQSGPFGVTMFLTDDLPGMLDRWYRLHESPELRNVHGVAKGLPITAGILFRGCAAGKDGNCNVTYSVKTLTPAGSSLAGPVIAVWKRPPPTGTGLSTETMSVVLDPDDDLGEYRLVAVVTDAVAGREVTVSTRFEAFQALAYAPYTRASTPS